MLYIPMNWWHQVRSHGPNMAVNLNWLPFGTFHDEMLQQFPEMVQRQFEA
jgi:hypothetical protein